MIHNPLLLLFACSLLLPAANSTCHDNNTVTDICTGDDVDCLMEAFEDVTIKTSTGQDCFIINIPPGNHTITKPFTFTINITIRATDEQPTFVIFDMDEIESESHALLFADAGCVEIHGVQFIDVRSPGSIGFERITEVSITNSSFRLVAIVASPSHVCTYLGSVSSPIANHGRLANYI